MSDTYAVVNEGLVVNIIIWDGKGDLEVDGELVEVVRQGGIGWTYNGSEFIPPMLPEKTHEVHVSEAGQYRDGLISDAQKSITLLQTKLLMGRKLTTAESEKVNAVLDYIDLLNAVDISNAPNVNWPDSH